jgi:FAS-associated factor 2
VDEFEKQYGSIHPKFLISSYRSAVAKSDQDSKFLLIYLHSPDHENTESFCQHTLTSDELTHFVDHNMNMWAGSVTNPDAHVVGSQLGVATFPFLALLVCANNSVRVVFKMHGQINTEHLIEQLIGGMERSQQVLEAVRAERELR